MTTLTQSQTEKDFHAQMLGVYWAAKNECGYTATRFFQMINEQGGLPAAKRLLASDHVSDGFTRLWEHGRLDISMEYLVLQKPWCELFTDEELATARRRLGDNGVATVEKVRAGNK